MKLILHNTIHLKGIEDYNLRGNSRLGGKPDLPIDMEYPNSDNGFYEFILQINLDQHIIHGLPRKGLLSIFYGNLDNNEAVAYYFEDTSILQTKNIPTHLDFAGVTMYREHIPHHITISEKTLQPQDESAEYNSQHYSEEENTMHWIGDFLEQNSYIMHSGLQDRSYLYLKSHGFSKLLYGGGVHIDSESSRITYLGRDPHKTYRHINDLISCEMTRSFYHTQEEVRLWIQQLELFDSHKDMHLKQFNDYQCILSLASFSEAKMVWGDFHKLEFYGYKTDFVSKNIINLDSTII